jgi:uncharacterized membrane protein YeaQ/YmgE (transglycosylase-associated protein family)
MSIIGWIILGLVSGFIASKLVNHQGEESFSTSCSVSWVRLSAGGYFRSLALPR